MRAIQGTDQYAQARLFEDVDVVVVGVPHGPAGGMAPGLLDILGVHVLGMSHRPLFVLVGL